MTMSASTPIASVTPLWRLMATLGVESSRELLAQACGADDSMAAMAQRLADRGIPARCVEIKPSDLPFLDTPTLVGLKQGGTAVLHHVGLRKATLELSSGELIQLPHRQADQVLGSSALELTGARSRSPSLLAQAWQLLRATPRSRQALLRVVALAVLFNALGYVTPVATQMVIDQALPDGARDTLLFLAFGTVLLGLHQAWTSWLRERTAHFLDAHCENGILELLFRHTIHLPFSALRTRQPGELQQLLASGEAIGAALTSDILLPVVDAVLGLGFFLILLYNYPQLALLSALVALLVLGMAVWTAQRLSAGQERIIERTALERNVLLELIAGAPTLKVAGAEHVMREAWKSRMLDEQRATLQVGVLDSFWQHSLDLCEKLLLVSVLLWGGYQCLHGHSTVGMLLASLSAMASQQQALRRLTQTILKTWQLRKHAARVESALRVPAEPALPPGGLHGVAQADQEGDAIVVDHVWFRYAADAPWVLQNYSMRIPRGRSTEIRWPSGQGKTTLLRLLAGLLTPEQGHISIERREARHARDLVCYLPQATHLFAGTLRENLRLLSGHASPERIAQAAQATGLSELVESWPMQLDTVVAAGGTNISGGQRQLLLLTAAVASERPIVLLDESLSNVDRIQRTLLEAADLLQGRTVVSVVHDGVRSASQYANDE